MLATLAFLLTHQATNPEVTVTVDTRGSFTVELYADKAPRTVEHFLGLVNEGFYNGILWHRLVPGFVLQTGDPVSKSWLPQEAKSNPGPRGSTKGLGEAAYGPSIKFEKNDLKHDKGTLGIALESPGDDSGSSHFFINLVDNHRLNGKYVVFGKVKDGWEIVETVRRGDLIRSIQVKD